LIAAAITIVLARYPAASCVLVLLQGSLSLLATQLHLETPKFGYLVMAITFGLYRVIYGLAVMFHAGRNPNG
jgi:uncharacterized membrane protein HdeD (DUF308 family)